MVVLAVQFTLRVATGPRYEPLALFVTRVVTPALPFDERPTPGPPKRFAQSIGLVVTIAASVLAFGFGLVGWAYALIALLVVFAILESVFGICVGCKAVRRAHAARRDPRVGVRGVQRPEPPVAPDGGERRVNLDEKLAHLADHHHAVLVTRRADGRLQTSPIVCAVLDGQRRDQRDR